MDCGSVQKTWTLCVHGYFWNVKHSTQSDFNAVFSSAAIVSTNKTLFVSSVHAIFWDGSQHSSPGQLCKVSGRSTQQAIEKDFKRDCVTRENVFLD